jgi:hypothetical protein
MTWAREYRSTEQRLQRQRRGGEEASRRTEQRLRDLGLAEQANRLRARRRARRELPAPPAEPGEG